ncbi:MAG: hypothetical protein DRP84_11405 [Spirochaetes bacterium]|nr:MAG: hypothetical protein DRP84_11405 [Spirochaetota bacterium]RKX99973.1 MAG: hypothetical protein DRP55_06460 [Spirochaetota bacterium]
MQHLVLTVVIIFSISFIFSMFGKGGGEFYIPTMITLLSIPFYTAAGISVFLIFLQSISMVFVYHIKNKLIDWHLAIVLAFIIGTFSFLGGFFSVGISPIYLKILFSIFLLISAYFMIKEKKVIAKKEKWGVWHREFGDISYDINLLYLLPPIALISVVVGMIGISGGGLMVPLLILLGGVPIRVAMGTNTFLILASSSMSVVGHVIHGGIDWKLASILGVTVISGSQIGSRLHSKIGDLQLKFGFVAILIVAAGWMVLKIFV